MRSFKRQAPILAGVLSLVTGLWPMQVAAQPIDPFTLLDASTAAMLDVQTARFTGSLATTVGAPDGSFSFSFAVPFSGALQGQRMSMLVSAGALAGLAGVEGDAELVVVEDLFCHRVGSTPWTAMSLDASGATMPINPNLLLSLQSSLLSDPVVVDEGSVYRLTSGLDFTAFFDLLSVGMPIPVDVSLPDFSMTMEMTIRKSNFYSEDVAVHMLMPIEGQSMAADIQMAYQNFNDPTIRVEAPAGCSL